MKVTITTTHEKELEIRFPYYLKSLCFAYKVINETTALRVQYGGLSRGLEVVSANVAFADFETKQSMFDDEFQRLYDDVCRDINLIINNEAYNFDYYNNL